jgi:ribosome-associated protein
LTQIADYFLICSGESTTQVRAIAEKIEEELQQSGLKPSGIEGKKNNLWVLMDYGDVIIHIFEEQTRAYYELEKLWIDARKIQPDSQK